MTSTPVVDKFPEVEAKHIAVDLEFEYYLFEVFLNDRIESEILRMTELDTEPLPLNTTHNDLQEHYPDAALV